jgi:hypothetical protein|tara:strand:+ start:3109 stop:3432 length:324 start_codon:yes stop_codon:yes gene_type:complete
MKDLKLTMEAFQKSLKEEEEREKQVNSDEYQWVLLKGVDNDDIDGRAKELASIELPSSFIEKAPYMGLSILTDEGVAYVTNKVSNFDPERYSIAPRRKPLVISWNEE